MQKSVLIASTAALLAIAGCGNHEAGSVPIGGEGENRAAASVDPRAVATQDLQAAVSDDRVRRFYEARQWRPAWTAEAAQSLVSALRQSDRHGLDPSEFVAPVQAASGPAATEAALTRAALDFADALGNGRVDPNEIRDIYTVPQPKLDLVSALAAAVEAGRPGEWLAGLAPDDEEYRALSEAYLRYARQAAGGGGGEIGSGELIREGDTDPRVPQVVEVLRSNGYLGRDPQQQGGAAGAGAAVYTAEIAAAVERMQEDYGIAADGIVGPDTLEVLNTGPDERARTLAVNLERRRWLERNAPATRIDVNTAAAVLDYYRDGRHADRRKVIVGQPGWETPQLGSPIYRLVANPTWTVPRSIEREEIEPRGPDYLRRNNMVRRDGWIVQLPGPDNALGQVKFDMQNDHAIYLHDTPAQHLFERNQRHFSHGCIRVEDAEGFARMLAEENGVLAEFQQAMASGRETFVDLNRHIPVRLVYHTAFLAPSGQVMFRTDPYGWDDGVAAALGYEARNGRRFQTHISDVGP